VGVWYVIVRLLIDDGDVKGLPCDSPTHSSNVALDPCSVCSDGASLGSFLLLLIAGASTCILLSYSFFGSCGDWLSIITTGGVV